MWCIVLTYPYVSFQCPCEGLDEQQMLGVALLHVACTKAEKDFAVRLLRLSHLSLKEDLSEVRCSDLICHLVCPRWWFKI